MIELIERERSKVEDGIIAVDKSGNILNYNKGAENLLGISKEDLGNSVLIQPLCVTTTY